MGADVILITFCELQGSVEVDVECKYSGGLRATDVSNSCPKCTTNLWDSTTLCTAVTSLGPFCFCSFRTHRGRLDISCSCVSTKIELSDPFTFSAILKKATFYRIPRKMDHGNAILHYKNSCYSLSTYCLPGLGQLLYISSYFVLRAALKEGSIAPTVQMKKLKQKPPSLGGDWSK